MFYFTKQEKIVILFLTGAIILGLSVQWARSSGNLTSIQSIKIEGKTNPIKKGNMNRAPVNGFSNGVNKKININTASIDELDALPGIGPKIAAEIIKYREKSGEFKAIENIRKVRGIGGKKFNKIKDKISINDETTMP